MSALYPMATDYTVNVFEMKLKELEREARAHGVELTLNYKSWGPSFKMRDTYPVIEARAKLGRLE